MRIAFPAVAALAATLLDLSVAPHFSITGVHPHLTLVLGVIATVAFGAEPGLIWAFVGGTMLDVLASRPVGATSLTLLIVLGAVAVIAQWAPRRQIVVAVGLVPLTSAVSSILLVVALRVLGTSMVFPDAAALLPGIAYDAAIGAVVAPFAIMLAARRPAGYVRA